MDVLRIILDISIIRTTYLDVGVCVYSVSVDIANK